MIVFVAIKIKNIKFFSKFIWMKNRFECHEKIESTQLSETNILIISSSPGGSELIWEDQKLTDLLKIEIDINT